MRLRKTTTLKRNRSWIRRNSEQRPAAHPEFWRIQLRKSEIKKGRTMCKTTLFVGMLFIFSGTARADDPWIIYQGGGGPGKGKHIVLVAADDEYRSEELIPQLAKILAKHHGFTCTVLFAIDKKDGTINPGQRDNIP